MNINFIPASSLKKQYEVLAHFYSLAVPGAGPLKCRSILEIKSKDAPPSFSVDAVFVLMNPGSSRPTDKEHELVEPLISTPFEPTTNKGQLVDSESISVMTRALVPTEPDTTQYQVMRVMNHANWKHVRVINLSDLRDPESGSFSGRYVQLEQQTGCKAHSIFSSERSEELKQSLSRRTDGPIVCAWGVSDSLQPLIERATSRLGAESGVTGLEKSDNPGRYFHPLPRSQHEKEKWVTDMTERLKS